MISLGLLLCEATGKERDTESGLDYFGARYYSSGQSRFLSPDEFTGCPVDAFSSSDPLPPGPLPYADITNPQSLNKYTYTYNNPLNFTDPDGHQTCPPVCSPVDVQTVLHVYEMVTEQAPKVAAAGTSLLLKVLGAAAYALSFGAEPVGVGSSLDDHPEVRQQLQQINDAIKPKRGTSGGPSQGKRATPAQRKRALAENDGKCIFCGKKAEHVDHAVPRSRKGNTTPGNLQPTCAKCNLEKGAKTTKEYFDGKKARQKQKEAAKDRD